MSKEELAMEIALLHLEDVEIPERKVQKKKRGETKHTTPEFRETVSERMKRLWSDSQFREKQLERLRSMEHTGHSQTPETRAKMRAAWTEERRQQHSETLKKAFSDPKIKEKLSNRIKGQHWWHKGPINTFSFDCPGDGWERGRFNKDNQSE